MSENNPILSILTNIQDQFQNMEDRFKNMEDRFSRVEDKIDKELHSVNKNMEDRFRKMEDKNDEKLHLVNLKIDYQQMKSEMGENVYRSAKRVHTGHSLTERKKDWRRVLSFNR